MSLSKVYRGPQKYYNIVRKHFFAFFGVEILKFFDEDPGSGMEKSQIRDSGSGMNVSDLEHFNYYAPFLFDVVFTFRVFFPGSDLLRKRICFNCKMWLPVTNAGRKIRLNFPIMIRNSDLIDRYKIRFFQKKKKKNI